MANLCCLLTGSGPVDLVMTLYPKIPELLQSQPQAQPQPFEGYRAQGQKGHGEVNSVVHEARVVTPPHGYLPTAGSKPARQSITHYSIFLNLINIIFFLI